MSIDAIKHNAARRNFLGWSARMAALGAGAPFALNLAALGAASAETASDYKAIVCIFLYGGNDNHNTVIPYDQASYNGYQQARGGIARARSTLLPLTPLRSQGGREFALPPELQPLATLFAAGAPRSSPMSGRWFGQPHVRNIKTALYLCRRSSFLTTTSSRCGRRRCPRARCTDGAAASVMCWAVQTRSHLHQHFDRGQCGVGIRPVDAAVSGRAGWCGGR